MLLDGIDGGLASPPLFALSGALSPPLSPSLTGAPVPNETRGFGETSLPLPLPPPPPPTPPSPGSAKPLKETRGLGEADGAGDSLIKVPDGDGENG